MSSEVKGTISKEPAESLVSRLLPPLLLAWVIIINLAFYWYVARAYGVQVLNYLQVVLP